MAGDPTAVPPQERVGRDQPPGTSWPGECLGDGAEQGPVVVGEGRAVDLAAEHRELVA